MGETTTTSASSEQHANAALQPTATATVNADEDEPPSTDSSPRAIQMTVAAEGEHEQQHDQQHHQLDHPDLKVLSDPLRERKTIVDFKKDDGAETNTSPTPHMSFPSKDVYPKTIKQRLRMLYTPAHPVGPRPTFRQSLIATIKYSPLNIFLLCVPISWALHYTHQSPTPIFIMSALGILPLAALLGLGTEQVALRTSQSVGGLLNATLGNVVELIVAGIALGKCDLALVQSSLLGGLLSNLLLVLGMAFLIGGFRFHQQEFQPIVAQLNLSLMTLSVITLLIPAAFHEFLGQRVEEGEEGPILLQISRGTAVILLLIYISYLFFQFYSHSHLFVDSIQQASSRRSSTFSSTTTRESMNETLPLPATSDPDEIERPRLNITFAICLLGITTALAYLTAEFLIDALDDVAESAPFSKEFLMLIIIPIISNAAEHTTAVVVARKGKFDLALGVAVGSCIQIALFVIPVLVLSAWGVGKPLTLVFDPLETLCLFFSVLLVKFAVEDGRAHWMSGVVLVAVYIVIALSFWNFPDSTASPLNLVCS